MPRAQRRRALASALSLKASENAVVVLDSLEFAEPRTREMAETLKRLGLADKRTLLVLGKASENVVRSCRNLPNLRTTLAEQVNPYDLVNCEMLLLTRDGLERMKEVFAR